MKKQKVRRLLLAGLIVFALSFLLLFFGVRGILNRSITGQNILAYAILSTVFGSLAGVFHAFSMKAAFFSFLAGLIVGFSMMYAQFSNGMDGWADLAGLMSLFLLAGIGLALGLVIQLVLFLVRKTKKGNG